MDPFTQGMLGAALPISLQSRQKIWAAGIAGFIAGMAPDLDVLIQSSTDSLLYLEYHRQFSHSLFFVPIGSFLIAALLYLPLSKWCEIDFRSVWLFSALGFATHGLLDTATSYGTQLLWPISETRFSFSIVSVVDPLFTVPLALLVGCAMWRRNGRWGRLGLVWGITYLSIGLYQSNQALDVAEMQAAERGHSPLRIEVKPTFGNLVVWKSIYETEDYFHVDGVRPHADVNFAEGEKIAKLDLDRDFPWLDRQPQQAKDVVRFARFSDGYLAASGTLRIADVRYSFLPTRIDPLWSIELDRSASPSRHVQYVTHRNDRERNTQALLKMIFEGFDTEAH